MSAKNIFALMKMKGDVLMGVPAVFYSSLEADEICRSQEMIKKVTQHFYGECADSYLNPGEHWAIVYPHASFTPIEP